MSIYIYIYIFVLVRFVAVAAVGGVGGGPYAKGLRVFDADSVFV